MSHSRNMFTIKVCKTASEFEKAKKITKDYIEWLGMDLKFQNIEHELAGFNVMYSPPKGRYLIAITENGDVAGGVGMRKFGTEICEMKRLFVYTEYLRQGLGEELCRELIRQAKKFGYKKMRLDTIGRLKAANKLYDKLGFYEIEAYTENPDKTARFFEFKL